MLRNVVFDRCVAPALLAMALITSCAGADMGPGRDKSGTNLVSTLAGYSQVVKEPLLTASGSLDTERGRFELGRPPRRTLRMRFSDHFGTDFSTDPLVEAEGIRRLAHTHLEFSTFRGILTPTDTTRCRGLEPCTP